MEFDLSAISATITTFLTEFGLRLLGALVFVILGRMVAKFLSGTVRRSLTRGGADETLVPFIGNIIYAVLLAGIFIAAAGMVGIEAGSFIAIVGAAGLAIALAFQGTLSNFASGVLLLTLRHFKVGDFVEVGNVSGTVQEIAVFTTTLHTPDNVRIIIPNSKISNDIIKNFSANATRRIDLVVGISYDDDLNLAIATIEKILRADERVLNDPEPTIAVSEMADSSVNLIVRPWVNTPDLWPTRWALVKELKEGLEAAGCSIPYPQRDLHLFQPTAQPTASE